MPALPEFEKRLVIWDATGEPTVVLREPPGTECLLTQPSIDTKGYWAGYQLLGTKSTYVRQAWDKPIEEAEAAPFTSSSPTQAGNEDVFVLWHDFGAALETYDKQTQLTFATPQGLFVDPPHVTPDAAFFRGFPDFNVPEGWIWSRSRGTFERFLDIPNKHIVDINADGNVVVWVETDPPPNNDPPWPQGILYQAPYTNDKTTLQKTAVRTMPATGPGVISAVGGGYYATSQVENEIYIVRLSDGYAVTYPIPIDEFNALIRGVNYIDDTYLFYRTETYVYRQRIDALGPWSPP